MPETIHEAVQVILNMDGIELLKEEPTEAFHHTVGRQIRNDWKLWFADSLLHREFNDIGIFHADDMSAILFDMAQKILLGESIRLKEQVNRYQKYWRENK